MAKAKRLKLKAITKQELKKLREEIREKVKLKVPEPGEAKRLGWTPLYDPNGEEIIGYLKPNGDIVFVDGTIVRKRAIEVDGDDEVDKMD